MLGVCVLVAVAMLGIPAAYALEPGAHHEINESVHVDYDMSHLYGIIYIDPILLQSYDLYRYVIDGKPVVLEGRSHPEGMMDIRLSPHSWAADQGADTGAIYAHEQNATGSGMVVAIVDTGTDFSNPDMVDAVARDSDNHPLMLDPDGQGIILTNNTFRAFVDGNGVVRNAFNHTVFVNDTGVYLDIYRYGEGTTISVYNSLFPVVGQSTVLEGLMDQDIKIGHDSHDYIRSKSGVYHLGVSLQMSYGTLQAVPILVTDPNVAGVYDTVTPDMATAWQAYVEAEEVDLDFTDDAPITLGNGNEALLFDGSGDGVYDFSAGMIGARVLDVYGVFGETTPEGYVAGAINSTLLDAVDVDGNYVGVMTDMHGHGTAVAGLVASRGNHTYHIYNDTRTYTIPGTAPGSTILPIKALWYGSVEYGWMWAAGMDNNGEGWEWSGEQRADIISNSWGVSVFPLVGSAPGYDYLSMLSDVLMVPGSLHDKYPGTLMIASSGNSGHGYGTIALPAASALGVSVGATFNSGYVQYGPFAQEPRFGNQTGHYGHLAQLTSRGPGAIGDVKPDILSIGAFGFVPTWITHHPDDETYEPFGVFGGTSMASPLVAGGAAVLMGQMEEAGIPYTPFTIKNILMSAAADTGNDPMAQGTGKLDVGTAVRYVQGDGPFVVTNDASYGNIHHTLQGAAGIFNLTELGLGRAYVPDKPYPMTSWFVGHLEPGARSSTTFTIHNPTSDGITVRVQPHSMVELEVHQSSHTTIPRQQDAVLNGTGVYTPNYILLSDARTPVSLQDLYAAHPIPESDLMAVNLNFEFDQFMNATATYADDITIASLYMYDWHDHDNDSMINYTELALVNRAGSWGTGQELRVSYPDRVFSGVPVVGVYPVPIKASYWTGVTETNSTAINYTMTVSYHGYEPWNEVWTDSGIVEVPPGSSASVRAVITVPADADSGVYSGYVRFISGNHTVSSPVSYAVTAKLDGHTILSDGTTGLARATFDMSDRYTTGEWKQHYLDVPEDTESVIVGVGWTSNNTHVGVIVLDPSGEIIQTNTNPGVFGDLADWPSNDWLGYSPFSGGGGFYPVRNWNDTVTILYVPTSEPGIYTILSHVSLHGGENLYETIRVWARVP